MKWLVLPVLGIALVSLASTSVQAIVTSDFTGSHMLAVGNPLGDAVGLVSLQSNQVPATCSCSLLADGKHILTAGHCFNGSPTGISGAATWETTNGDVTIGVTQFVPHPAFVNAVNGSIPTLHFLVGHDLGIGVLANEAPAAIPRLDIFRSTDGSEIGVPFARIGYGRQGIGSEGFNIQVAPDLEKRGAFNNWETEWQQVPELASRVPINSPLLLYDFDSGSQENNVFGSLGYGAHEVMAAPGDSGSPNIISSSLGMRIAGVTSGAYDSSAIGLASKDAKAFDGIRGLSSWGDVGLDTRVSSPLNQHFIDLYIAEGRILGDIDLSGQVTTVDVHVLQQIIRNGQGVGQSWLDLNLDGSLNVKDTDDLVRILLRSEYGDVNYDHRVNQTDVDILALHIGATGVGWAEGDLDGDGAVTGSDLSILAAHFGFEPDDNFEFAHYNMFQFDIVPEPATSGLMALAIAAGFGIRRR